MSEQASNLDHKQKRRGENKAKLAEMQLALSESEHSTESAADRDEISSDVETRGSGGADKTDDQRGGQQQI